MMDFRIFENILPFLSACGNNLTHGKDVDNIKEWPSLAVAFNEVSNVHCTATIGTYFVTQCKFYRERERELIFQNFLIFSESTMGFGQLFLYFGQV